MAKEKAQETVELMERRVINGPSKWDLMLAIFDPASHHDHGLAFATEDHGIVENYIVQIMEVGIITEEFDKDCINYLIQGFQIIGNEATCQWVKIRYSTITRKGFFGFEDPVK